MTTLDDARAQFEAGAYEQAREAAMQGLAVTPEDIELLRIAGRSGVETAADDAVGLLRRVTELRPDDGVAWRDLGDALATEGLTQEASEAFAKAVGLDPEDAVALGQLGHSAAATGRDEEAVSYLSQAADRSAGKSSAAISLVDMYRTLGQFDEALAAARKVAEADPEDIVAALDVAELSLTVGRLDEALSGFEHVREIEELADHEIYALHGMLQVEIQRERWDRALELASEAVVLDQRGRTSEVLAFLEAQAAGHEGDQAQPTREEVDAALISSAAEHRRAHDEDLRADAGEPHG